MNEPWPIQNLKSFLCIGDGDNDDIDADNDMGEYDHNDAGDAGDDVMMLRCG